MASEITESSVPMWTPLDRTTPGFMDVGANFFFMALRIVIDNKSELL